MTKFSAFYPDMGDISRNKYVRFITLGRHVGGIKVKEKGEAGHLRSRS
jgi:hypothetical protein